MFAGLLATPVVPTPVALGAVDSTAADPRLPLLVKFFEDNNAPLSEHAEDFLKAADRNDLDWRLLPSISMVESSGGKFYRNNNVFGWDGCNERFPSIRAGIHIVASRLATSKLYRNKSLEQILRTYNGNDEYPRRVKTLMRLIGPADVPVTLTN